MRALLGELAQLEAAAPSAPITLTAGDLEDLGVPRGPMLGTLLGRVQRASLGGAFDDRAGALGWVEDQLR